MVVPPPTNSPFLYFLQPNKSNVRVVDECDEALAICVTQAAHRVNRDVLL